MRIKIIGNVAAIGLCAIGLCAISQFSCIGIARATGAPPPPPPTADQGDTWFVYAEDQELYDSNLFRLPSNLGTAATVVAPNATKDDTINTASLGADGQLILGRQVLALKLRADISRFAHNDELNNTSGDARFLWDWQVGGHLNGEVGADYNRSLASFTETRFLGRDLVDATDYFANGRYQIGPHWAVIGGVREEDYTHSAAASQFNDLRIASGNARVEYSTGPNDALTLQYKYSDGRYPSTLTDELDGTIFGPDYHDSTTTLGVKHDFTEKTHLNAYAGYLKRDYLNTTVGAFSGDIWRAEVLWQTTEKTELIFSAYHELHAYLASQSDYFIAKGFGFAPVWKFSEKLQFYLTLSYENQDYIPSSTSALTLGPTNAKATSEIFSLVYSPRSAWIFSFLFSHNQRNSNQEVFQYGDNFGYVSAIFKTK